MARKKTPADFLTLLELCHAQVEADPEGVTENPHLYGSLQAIYLRLCHGSIPDWAVAKLRSRTRVKEAAA